jgi:hypothetical protein
MNETSMKIGWLYNATMATSRLCDDGVKRKECRTEVAKSYYSLFNIYWGHSRKLLSMKIRHHIFALLASRDTFVPT